MAEEATTEMEQKRRRVDDSASNLPGGDRRSIDESKQESAEETDVIDCHIETVVVFLLTDPAQIDALLDLPHSPINRGATPFHSLDIFLNFLVGEVTTVAPSAKQLPLENHMPNAPPQYFQHPPPPPGAPPRLPAHPLCHIPARPSTHCRLVYHNIDEREVADLVINISNWGTTRAMWVSDAVGCNLSAGSLLIIYPPNIKRKETDCIPRLHSCGIFQSFQMFQ